jgi:hypothetical protein
VRLYLEKPITLKGLKVLALSSSPSTAKTKKPKTPQKKKPLRFHLTSVISSIT